MTIELFQGDCFDIYQNIKADLILTDPPYGLTNCKWDTPIDLVRFWSLVSECSSGKAICFSQTPFDKVLGCSNIKNLKYEIIWEKTLPTGFLNAKKMPLKSHENILVFGKLDYYPQKSKGKMKKTYSSANAECYGYHKKMPYHSDERYPKTVVKFSKEQKKHRFHPTQKPLALMEYLIKTYSKEGDTIFDPFMGSGTTGVACKNLNRNFIGIEKDETIFITAKKRIAEYEVK